MIRKEITHGFNSGYRRGCRCMRCRVAHSAAAHAEADPTRHMAVAFAERFGVTARTIRIIGTLQLCLCRSDEARRILLRAVEAESIAGKKANAVMNERRRAA